MISFKNIAQNKQYSWSKFLYTAKLASCHQTRCISSSNEAEATVKDLPDPNSPEDAEVEDLHVIDKKRNVSGLSDSHYRIKHKKVPQFSEDEMEVMPLWRYRKLYGRFGSQAQIDMKCLWPSDTEMKLTKEKEQLEFPNSVQEMIRIAREEKMQKEKEIMDQQNEIKENLKQLEKWKEGVRSRIAKKEEIAKKALERKQNQIDEVRAELGYHISPFDPKFQEIVERKEEEEKKRKKKEKKLHKEKMLLKQLTDISNDSSDKVDKDKPMAE